MQLRKKIVRIYKKLTEQPDPTPLATPAGFYHPPSLEQRMMQFIRSERFAQQVQQQGHETFEEADDFDVGDDFDPTSPYEEQFDHEVNIQKTKEAISKGKKKLAEKKIEEQVPVPKS